MKGALDDLHVISVNLSIPLPGSCYRFHFTVGK
jgi:hypothetical protein